MIRINHILTDEIFHKILTKNYVHVIDDFYENLDWLENIDLSQLQRTPYDLRGTTLYLPKDLHLQIHQSLIKLFGSFSFMADTGWLKVLTAKDGLVDEKGVHFDFKEIALLVCLNDPPDEESASDYHTVFYQHKDLFFKKCPMLKDKDFPLFSKVYQRDRKKHECWQPWFTPEFKKNRALLFHGNLLHSNPKRSFGQELSSGRLTQNFVFRPQPGQVDFQPPKLGGRHE